MQILKVHSKGKKLAPSLDLLKVARRTPGMTGADLQNLMNEAAILTARRKGEEITLNAIEDALEKIIAGPEKKGSVINERKRRLVAYHEVRYARLERRCHLSSRSRMSLLLLKAKDLCASLITL